jgi:hypothetical protein
MNCVIKSKLSTEVARYYSARRPAELVDRLGVPGVFARGIPVAGGIVGSADIVFHDSPPLTGWASSEPVSFVGFGKYRVTSVTPAETARI